MKRISETIFFLLFCIGTILVIAGVVKPAAWWHSFEAPLGLGIIAGSLAFYGWARKR